MGRPRNNAAWGQRALPTPDKVAGIPVEEQPYPLPEGWKWVRLGDALHLQAGKNISARNIHSEKTDEFPYPCFGGNGIRGYVSEYNHEGNFPLIGRQGALCGNIKFASGKFYATEHAVAVSGKLPHEITWVSYCLRNMNLNQYATATAQPGLAVSTLNQLPFPYPPLDEQQRIVDRIESLFAKLDEAKAKAEAVLDGFEIRKAAILHKAFTGELTAKWRELKNITLESWSSCPLISVLKENPRNGYSPKPVEYKTNVKSMTLSATTSGFFRPEFFKYIDEEIPENSYLWLSQGDILIQRANSLEKVGTSAIYTSGEYEFIYPDLIMKVQVKNPHSYKYIAYILSTQATLNYFRANATGTAGNMPKINQQIVSNTPIVVPSSEEQQEIVRILDNLLAKERHIRDAAENVQNQIELMKKAILARAFRGELGTHGASKNSPQWHEVWS